MFQVCNYISTIKPYKETHRFLYEVIDDDFKEQIEVSVDVSTPPAIDVIIAVIDVYSNRNLPVVPNLMAAIVFEHQQYGSPVKSIMKYAFRYIPKFAQYEEELNKYLVLL